ncbi:MAG: cell division protein FtsL [Treponema sp.]|nr:cell division protein FtsL [Candidatus Treponema equifaecale]
MKSEKKIKLIACIAVVMIPILLILDAFQAKKYSRLKKDLEALELKQQELVEKNRKLISDISLLSSSDRIEQIAEGELGMHKAKSEDIVRVEIK